MSQTQVHTFAINFWHFKTFATKVRHFQTFATTMIRRDLREQNGDGATEISRPIFGMCILSRPRLTISRLSRSNQKLNRNFVDQDLPFPDFRDQTTVAILVTRRIRRHQCSSENGAKNFVKLQTIATEMKTARPRKKLLRILRPNISAASCAIKAETARIFQTFAIEMETMQLSSTNLARLRKNLSRLLRPRRRWRDFCD